MDKKIFLIALLSISTSSAQVSVPDPQPLHSPVQVSASADPQGQAVVIPAGTRIPLTLSSPIAVKAARPGTVVRAVTAFPVTVGTQMAIPVGAFVEGVIDKVTKGGPSGFTLQIHFTRVLFSNGYSVPVDGANLQTRGGTAEPILAGSAASSTPVSNIYESGFILAAPQFPTQPTTPKVGPNIALISGIIVAVTATVITLGLLIGRHSRVGGVLYDTGWQFEMVLNNPVSINAASVPSTGAISSAP